MQIIIPMSGFGERFRRAGYNLPKPLIEVEGKPIIAHVIDMFPDETDFIFICNRDHLENPNYKMRDILKKLSPSCKIFSIKPHKLGPVYAVYSIEQLIKDEEEVIVNYCDFGTYWDYRDFLKHTRDRDSDGAVPSYKGFHPHMLGSTNYAFMRDNEQWMQEIKEKEPFTDNRMQEYASSGTYYFKKGSYVKKYFKELMDNDISLKGEYYVSLIYNLLVRDNLKVSIYEIQHMLQWGTPEDVQEYNTWSKYFYDAIKEKEKPKALKNSLTLIPLAGHGSRFTQAGYKDPKPLINVSGKPMIIQAAKSLPNSENHIFVTLKDHLENYPLEKTLKNEYPDSKVVAINEVTKGQAITCSLGLKDLDINTSLLIAATDNGMIYDRNKYQKLIEDENVDAIVFTFRHHVSSKNNPHMYGWVKTDNNQNANGVSVKSPISENPYDDHAIVGTFYFKKIAYFDQALKSLLDKDIKVNGEYYVDSLIGEIIELDMNVKVFEIEDYIGWGTPDDYNTFVYWQSFFNKVSWHPYSLEKDITVNKDKIKELDLSFRNFNQEFR